MEAKKRIYIGLLASSLLFLVLLFGGLWFIFFHQQFLLNQFLSTLLTCVALVLVMVLGTGILAMVIMIIRSRTSPWQESVARIVNEWLFPVALLVGKAVHMDRDSILQSFISVNNFLVRSKRVQIEGNQVMILAPHCLQASDCPHKITIDVENCKECGKCKIGELKKLSRRYHSHFKVATGGTLARKFIRESRPRAVIAIACERDLSLGIQETVIPVLGVLNCRPNGPCLNTDVNLDSVETALHFLKQGG